MSYKDPVFWVWLEKVFTPSGSNFKITISPPRSQAREKALGTRLSPDIFVSVQYRESSRYGPFEAKHCKRYGNCLFFFPRGSDVHPSSFIWGSPGTQKVKTLTFQQFAFSSGSRDGAVVRPLASKICPEFDSRTRRHMWVEFLVVSLLCSETFFSRYSGFPLSSKTNISKFQFDPGMPIGFWTFLNEFLWPPWCSAGKQITFAFFFLHYSQVL